MGVNNIKCAVTTSKEYTALTEKYGKKRGHELYLLIQDTDA